MVYFLQMSGVHNFASQQPRLAHGHNPSGSSSSLRPDNFNEYRQQLSGAQLLQYRIMHRNIESAEQSYRNKLEHIKQMEREIYERQQREIQEPSCITVNE